jgi:ADP-heptose:LPS heptosyltransferase
VKHVLIIKMGALGDVVMATPMLTALHEAFPGIRVTWMVEEKHAPILQAHPMIDRVIPVNSGRWRRHLRKLRPVPWFRQWRAMMADVLQGGPVDALICCHPEEVVWAAFGSGVRQRVALFTGTHPRTTRRLYTHAVAPPDGVVTHGTRQYLLATRALGCADAGFALTLGQTADETPFFQRFASEHNLTSESPICLLSPFTTWENKTWEAERWADVAERIVRVYDAQVVITSGSAEAAQARLLVDSVAADVRPSVFLAGNTTIREFVALIRNADVVVGCDSSAMHIAAAVGTPFVTLFGPTDVDEIAPLAAVGIALRRPVACSPCRAPRCANPEFKACMLQITAEDVTAAVGRTLSRHLPVLSETA